MTSASSLPSPFDGATIVFDLDGTLIDTAPDLTEALNVALKADGHPPVPPASVRASVGFGAKAMIETGLRLVGAGEKADDAEAVEHMLADFLAYYDCHIADHSRPFDGALACIDKLRQNKVKTAICTNKTEALAHQLLHTLGLENRFDAIAGRDTFPTHKPDPHHLTGTILAAGGDVENALMVGDSIVDIRTARAASLPSIAVAFGYGAKGLQDCPPDAVIAHYDDLIPSAGRLLQRRAEIRHGPAQNRTPTA